MGVLVIWSMVMHGHSYGSALDGRDGHCLAWSKVRYGPDPEFCGLLNSLPDQIRGWVEDGARSGKLPQCQFYIIQVGNHITWYQYHVNENEFLNLYETNKLLESVQC